MREVTTSTVEVKQVDLAEGEAAMIHNGGDFKAIPIRGEGEKGNHVCCPPDLTLLVGTPAELEQFARDSKLYPSTSVKAKPWDMTNVPQPDVTGLFDNKAALGADRTVSLNK